MGSWFFSSNNKQRVIQQKQANKPKLEQVDIIKARLKQAKYKIQQFINAKNSDLEHIDIRIKQSVPKYEQTKNKKIFIPFLKAKKEIETLIANAQIRLKLLSEKLSEVQMNQLNKETVEALDQSNSYIKEVQKQMEAKDWRAVIDEAKNKYEIQWPDDKEDIEQDQSFKQMWKELGGDKVVDVINKNAQENNQKKNELKQKTIGKKIVNVQIQNQNQNEFQKRELNIT